MKTPAPLHTRFPLILAAALCCASPTIATAQQGAAPIDAALTPEQMKKADERFLEGTASINTLIIMESKYALEQVKNPRIRSIAEMLIEDHTKNSAALATSAAKAGMEVSDGLRASDQALLDASMKVKDEEFATCYLFDMAAIHFRQILVFARISSHSRNEAVKEYAGRSLPRLREHYTALKGLAQSEAGVTNDL